jgi:hypothetical protein
MLRNFKEEAKEITTQLLASMQATYPSRHFGSVAILSTVHLTITAKKISSTKNLNERRNCINEFDRTKAAIKKGIELLQTSPIKRPIQRKEERVAVS